MFFGPGTTPGGRGGQRRRLVHYASRKITITNVHVETAEIRVGVADLQGVVRCLTYRYPTLRVACVTAGGEMALAIPFAVAYGSAAMVGVGFVSGLGLLVGALVDARRNPRWMSIEADCDGRRVTLFSSRDGREFGQVCRALTRALEDHRSSLW